MINLETLSRVKNLHKNETVYIVGCGPSLNTLSAKETSKIVKSDDSIFTIKQSYACFEPEDIGAAANFLSNNS